ncbi:DUF6682 family protein [Aeromonas enteropelogenes]|uniref:phage adaptor protein n=1 Tax=Aeromonas enteropelogenes TaxID=29489 RepID=UPI003BA238F6
MQTIKELLDLVSLELSDKLRLRWTLDDLVVYYNAAVAAMANYRPDIFAHTHPFRCVAGTKQALPDGAIKLIEVERNTGGRKVRFFERGVLDDLEPDWLTGQDAEEVEAYCYEATTPKAFWVYPGVVSGVQIDLTVSQLPELVTTADVEAGATLPVDATYHTPLLDWIMYRAYLRDADDTVNSSRGQSHMQSFANYLGVTLQSDKALSSVRQQRYQTNQG